MFGILSLVFETTVAILEEKLIQVLKQDSFGRIELIERGGVRLVRRVACGGKIPCSGTLGRFFARREQRVLAILKEVPGIPRALGQEGKNIFYRSFLEGIQLNHLGPVPASYFDRLLQLLDSLHKAGITHNDLAKEANILIDSSQNPGLVDFQLAFVFSKKDGSYFEMLCREDRRHILKQKARHCSEAMSEAEWQALKKKSWVARIWSLTGMKLYHAVTRPLGWRDREGLGREKLHKGEKT